MFVRADLWKPRVVLKLQLGRASLSYPPTLCIFFLQVFSNAQILALLGHVQRRPRFRLLSLLLRHGMSGISVGYLGWQQTLQKSYTLPQSPGIFQCCSNPSVSILLYIVHGVCVQPALKTNNHGGSNLRFVPLPLPRLFRLADPNHWNFPKLISASSVQGNCYAFLG